VATLATARTRRRRRRRWIALGAVLLAVLLAVAVGWLLWASDLARVATVEVVGVDGALAADVEDVADIPVGAPLIGVELATAEAAVEAIPEVASAAVTRAWPDAVLVEVVPRTPVAVLAPATAPAGTTTPVAGEAWPLLDADGVVFGAVGPGDRMLRTLPVVRAVDTGQEQGQTPTQAAAAVVAALPPGLLEQVAIVEAFSPYEVRLGLTDGRVVVWGTPEESEEKAAVLAGLMTQDAARYDVSVPQRPTLLP
jgi:cell division protein FtsQ